MTDAEHDAELDELEAEGDSKVLDLRAFRKTGRRVRIPPDRVATAQTLMKEAAQTLDDAS